MIATRRLKYEKPQSWRLYKYDSEDELIAHKLELDKHHKKSVNIIGYGNITAKDLSDFEKVQDDYAYKDLNFKIGDLYLYTSELSTLKLEEESKKTKAIRNEMLDPKVTHNKYGWSDEQLKLLWNGSKEEVAILVNKKPSSVEKRRIVYLQDNPEFEYPESCRTKRKNASQKPIKVVTEWTTTELDIIWSIPGRDLSKLIKRNVIEINNMRREYCLLHPEFVIPIKAKFNGHGLPNKVESRRKKIEKVIKETKADYFWTDIEKTDLWNMNTKFFIEKYPKRTYHAVYMARKSYLENNPNFIIPQSAGFKVPKGLPNKCEVKVNSAKTVSKSETKTDVNSMDNIAILVNGLKDKPRKLTITSDGIELEF